MDYAYLAQTELLLSQRGYIIVRGVLDEEAAEEGREAIVESSGKVEYIFNEQLGKVVKKTGRKKAPLKLGVVGPKTRGSRQVDMQVGSV